MSPTLFFHVILIEAKKSLSYRVDFWLTVIGGFAAGAAVPYFMWTSIFGAGAATAMTDGEMTIGGYSLTGIIIYSIAAVLVGTVVRGSDLPLTIATDIYEGSLNRYLLYPASYLPFKFAQHIGGMVPALGQLFLFGGAGLAWGYWGAGVDLAEIGITPRSALMGFVSIMVANLLYFCLTYPLQLVAFWADNVWSLIVLLRFLTGLLGGAMLPLALFPEVYQSWIQYTPFPALFAVPIETLLGRVDFNAWLLQLAVALAWSLIIAGASRWIWLKGQLRYTGVGI